MSLVVNKAPVAHTRGYKFIFIRSHHMKEVEKTKSNVSAIARRHPPPAGRSFAGWSRRQICRAGKEKATLEAEIARLREVHSQKLSKEAQNWWRCRFSAQLPKRAGWYGQAEEKCSRTGGCAPNDRTGPWNGPRRDDRVFKDRVLSPSDDWYDRINPHLTCVSWSMRGLSCLLA